MKMITKRLVWTLLALTILSFSFLFAELNNVNEITKIDDPIVRPVEITGTIIASGPNGVVYWPSGWIVEAHFVRGSFIGERIGFDISKQGKYRILYHGTKDHTVTHVAVSVNGQRKFAPVNQMVVVDFQFIYNDPNLPPINLPVLPTDPVN